MAVKGEAKYRITVDNSEMEKAQQRNKREARETGQVIKDSFSKAGRVASAAMKAVAVAIGAATAAVGALVKKGLEYNAGIESLTTNLDTLLASEQNATYSASELVDQMRELAAHTPLATDALAANAQTLLSYGAATSGNVVETLQMLGDAAMGDQTKLDALSLAYSQMYASGKLMGQDAMQMINAGIPVYALVADYLNSTGDYADMTAGKVKELTSEGKITSEIVTAALEQATSAGGRYYEAMAKQSETLNGKISTLKDNFNMFVGSITEGFSPAAKKVVDRLNDLLVNNDKLKQSLEGSMNIIADFAADALPDLIDVIADFLPMMAELVANVMPVILDLMKALMPFIQQIIQSILPIMISLIEKLLPPISRILQAILPPLMRLLNALTPILELVIDIFANLFDALAPVIESLLNALLPVIESLLQVLSPLLEALNPILQIILDLIAPIIDWISLALEPLFILLDAMSPLLEGLGGLLELAFAPLKLIAEWLSPVVEDMKKLRDELQEKFHVAEGIEKAKEVFSQIADLLAYIVPGMAQLRSLMGMKSGQGMKFDDFSIVSGGGVKFTASQKQGTGGSGVVAKKTTNTRLAKGIDFAPSDWFPAYLDYGERVLTREQNLKFNSLGGLANLDRLSRTETPANNTPIYANIKLDGSVMVDGFTLGKIVLENLDDAAAYTLRG